MVEKPKRVAVIGFDCAMPHLIETFIRLERTMYLTDIVPTICYLMDWPIPRDVDGSVIYQLFDDPDFKRKQIESLNK